MTIVYEPIGTIHSPFKDVEGTPIQPVGAQDVSGTIVVKPEYCAGLKDLEGFSHVILIYHFNRSQGYSLVIKPFMDDTPRGLFATRAPKRPNPIGISVVRLERIENCTLYVKGVDIVDSTPLLDIKPYVPQFDAPEADSTGWLSKNAEKALDLRADNRFR